MPASWVAQIIETFFARPLWPYPKFLASNTLFFADVVLLSVVPPILVDLCLDYSYIQLVLAIVFATLLLLQRRARSGKFIGRGRLAHFVTFTGGDDKVRAEVEPAPVPGSTCEDGAHLTSARSTQSIQDAQIKFGFGGGSIHDQCSFVCHTERIYWEKRAQEIAIHVTQGEKDCIFRLKPMPHSDITVCIK